MDDKYPGVAEGAIWTFTSEQNGITIGVSKDTFHDSLLLTWKQIDDMMKRWRKKVD
jgi:hypothetical protein